MLYVVLAISLIGAVAMLVYSWKTNVAPSKRKKEKTETSVKFYDNDNYLKSVPRYTSNFTHLDENVSGAVRYNRSMYYSQNEFDKYKENVLSQELPT